MKNGINIIFAATTLTCLLSTSAMANTLIPGSMCKGVGNGLFNNTLQGVAVSTTFPSAVANCVANPFTYGGSKTFHITVKDMPGKPINCSVRSATPNAIGTSILASASSAGASLIETLYLTANIPAGQSSYISCTVPNIGRIITYGEVSFVEVE